MELKDRIAIIEEKNMCRLWNLYGEMKDVDELSKIINRHLEVAIDEIEKNNRRQKNAMAMAKIDKECIKLITTLQLLKIVPLFLNQQF